MAKKFLEALEKYAKEMGINLNEAVPGSTNVMTPPVTSNTGGQPNSASGASVDEIAKQEQDFLKTTNDVNQRIQSGSATPQDYEALKAATSGLADIQTQKAKLNPQQKPGATGGSTTPSATNNPLVKPLA